MFEAVFALGVLGLRQRFKAGAVQSVSADAVRSKMTVLATAATSHFGLVRVSRSLKSAAVRLLRAGVLVLTMACVLRTVVLVLAMVSVMGTGVLVLAVIRVLAKVWASVVLGTITGLKIAVVAVIERLRAITVVAVIAVIAIIWVWSVAHESYRWERKVTMLRNRAEEICVLE